LESAAGIPAVASDITPLIDVLIGRGIGGSRLGDRDGLFAAATTSTTTSTTSTTTSSGAAASGIAAGSIAGGSGFIHDAAPPPRAAARIGSSAPGSLIVSRPSLHPGLSDVRQVSALLPTTLLPTALLPATLCGPHGEL